MSSFQFCTGSCKDRTSEREAEEYQLLKAVARERLVKTRQAGKGLSGYCGDLQSVEISDSDVIACSSDKGMVRSDMSKPALIFFHCKSTHNKIHCQNFSC
jgi:hypothetical protein